MFKQLRSILAGAAMAAILVPCLAPAAFADIKAFNAAVKAGDYKTAATEAEVIWKSWDTTDPQTALMAREFGFAALVSGRNDLAQGFGKFLVEKGQGLPFKDDQPLTSAVLLRIAEFKLTKGGDAERAALRDALFARNAAPNVDMTSVLSWQALYTADWNKYDWDNVAKDTTGAIELLKRQPSLIPRQREAEVTAAAAGFIQNRAKLTPNNRAAVRDAMADLHDSVVADLNAATPALRNQLWPVKWQAEAWAGAIESYMDSSYAQIGSNISTALKPRQLAVPAFAPVAEDAATAAIPVCAGAFEGRKIQYPDSRAFEGLVGSVIVRLETGADGKVTTTEILSAVPIDGFGARVIDAMKDWKYKAKSTSNCRLSSRNHVQHVTFVIGR